MDKRYDDQMRRTKTAGRKLPKLLLHGGDYNPDQWLDRPDILEEDIRLMKEANINEASLGIFAWARLEPEEGVFELDWLAEIIDRLYENGIYTILATPTGALPHWLSEKYEETRQVLSDGTRKYPGMRHNFCPSSPIMREKMRKINRALGERFGHHPGVIAWHMSNEYAGGAGDHGDGACYCPLCQENFRRWLKEKYRTLDTLNHAWWTSFWSNTITDWNQIHAPSRRGESAMQGLLLDWRRFVSDQLLDFAKEEISVVRKYSDRPTVSNFMGAFKPLNYFKWAKELDLVALDNYPFWHYEKDDKEMGMYSSFVNTLTRSLKKQPFLLMESVPSVVNWEPRCVLKRPGMHELSSLQSIACGSDSVQYFQWRKGRGGNEKYHGAVVDHKNGGNTRVFADVSRVGERLKRLTPTVIGTCNRPKAAIVFDWENWWAVENAGAVENPFDYSKKWSDFYRPLFELGIDADIIDMEDPLEDYSLVIAPINYMYRANYVENVRKFVAGGGTYVTTYWSGEVDECDLCFLDHHPLSDVLGICTEEIDVSPDYVKNRILYEKKAYGISGICALVHAREAKVLGTYEKDFYAGYPAVTVNSYGKGKAYFIAAQTSPAQKMAEAEESEDFLNVFYQRLAKEAGCACTLELEQKLPYGVTVNERISETSGEEGASVWFVQNFLPKETGIFLSKVYRNAETKETVSGGISLAGYQCLILEEI